MNNNEYLKNVIDKFNTDKNHFELNETEKQLLARIQIISKNMNEIDKKMKDIDLEVKQKLAEINDLNLQFIKSSGAKDALTELLISSRK